ncbi:MAG TPA: hypothetical protein VMI72_05140 [Roseiarcus sp.]|nr:hypothetical protein [Roseiarcus sp.]
MSDIATDTLIPAPRLAQQLGVTRRTLARWIENPALGFPEAANINGRKYFSCAAIEAWKINRLRGSATKA